LPQLVGGIFKNKEKAEFWLLSRFWLVYQPIALLTGQAGIGFENLVIHGGSVHTRQPYYVTATLYRNGFQ